MKESVCIKFVYDPLWRIVNPAFFMLQQRNIVAQEVSSHVSRSQLVPIFVKFIIVYKPGMEGMEGMRTNCYLCPEECR